MGHKQLVMLHAALTTGVRRGFSAGIFAVVMFLCAALPSRLALAMTGWGAWSNRLEKVAAGTLIDAASALSLCAPIVAVAGLCTPWFVRPLRTATWQRLGPALCSLPFCLVLWFACVAAQEVKAERGAYPTMFDVVAGAAHAAFLGSVIGFVEYEHIYQPALLGFALAAGSLAWAWRSGSALIQPWRDWVVGLIAGLAWATTVVLVGTATVGASTSRLSTGAVGDPLTGIVESAVDLARGRDLATPRELIVDMEFSDDVRDRGAALMGWPPSHAGPHNHARPLDFQTEISIGDDRGRRLLTALGELSSALFAGDDGNVAVFQLALEGFRADDLHALNPRAPRTVAPYISDLYSSSGVLTSRQLFQAGVRTVQGLGAMTCGLGTLPYNLSFIRDVQPFPVRCMSDVLRDAGFAHSFYYGSDPTYDKMAAFLGAHGYASVVGQSNLPSDLPRGTWDGVTDLALFEIAVDRVAKALDRSSQFALIMSLSNHGPFTVPDDLPAKVLARVDSALATSDHRADVDDRRRLIAYAYTDAAVEHLFDQLDARGIADRSIVILMADHSTGHKFVWGQEEDASDLAKTRIPFAMVIPPAFAAGVRNRATLDAALARAQSIIDEAPLSQNDVPACMLALLAQHPALRSLAINLRWHTLGGQVTSPHFSPGAEASRYVIGINGVSQFYAVDRRGQRVGDYEESVLLNTRADRYRITPSLIPMSATLRANTLRE